MLSRLEGRGQETSSALLSRVPKTVKPGLIHIFLHGGLEQHLKHIGKSFTPSWLPGWCVFTTQQSAVETGENICGQLVSTGGHFFLLQAVFELNPLIKEQLSHSFLLKSVTCRR